MAIYPFVLAFFFGSHLLLSGLGLAAIPLLIHLLHRRSFVKTRWAAMRFLLQANQKHSRRSWIDQLLLMIIRILVIATFVVALARPILDALPNVVSGTTATHYILVFDASYSMQFQETDAAGSVSDDSRASRLTRFEKAKQQALQLVRQGQAGDLWNIVRVADDGVAPVLSPPSASTDFIVQEIQDLKVSDASGNLSLAFQGLLTLVRQTSDVPKKQIVVFTDMQANFLKPLINVEDSSHGSLVAELNNMASLSFVNVSNGPSPNVAVTELRPDRSYGLADRPSRLVSVIRNTGSTSPLRGQIVDLLIDDRIIETKRVDLPANISLSVEWQFHIQSPGEHLIEVRVEEDQLSIDNRRSILLPVRNELHALVVDSIENATAVSSSTTAFYVTRGLAPQLEGRFTSSSVRPTLILSTEFSSTKLDGVDVIVLCGCWRMSEREIRLLDGFVRNGGGLIVIADNPASIDVVNDGLYRDGAGPLAGKLVGHEKLEAINGAFKFDVNRFEHSMLREFQRNPGSGLEATLVFQFVKIAPFADAKVLLSFNNAAPAIVERQFGRGHSLLITTGPKGDWSTLGALAQSFVPLLHESVLQVVKSSTTRELEVGRTGILNRPQGATSIAPTLRGPDGTVHVLKTLQEEQSEHILLDGFIRAGLYQIEYGSLDHQPTRIVAVVNAEEGILAESDYYGNNLARAEVAPEEFSSGRNSVLRAEHPNSSAVNDFVVRTGLVVALLLLLIEPLFAIRFTATSCAVYSLVPATKDRNS